MMKRLIAAVLCVLLCCLSIGVWAAEEEVAAEGNPYSQAVGLLEAIGVFTPEQAAAFDPWGIITRGEFIAQLMDVMDSSIPSDGQHYFSDIASSQYADDINGACRLGIVTGYGNFEFRPDDPVTYSEAVTFLTRALGFESYANNYGGYPTGYFMAAGEADLLHAFEEPAWQEEVERGVAAQLMVNALNAEPLTLRRISADETIYESQEDGTLLWQTRKIRSASGYVTATPYTRLATATGAGKGRIEIDNSVYRIRMDGDMTQMLGSEVTYYYTDDEGDPEIVYIAEDESNDAVIIDALDVSRVENGVLCYNKEGSDRQSRAQLSSAVCVIYNGKAAPRFIIPESGQVKLVENGGGNGYDVAIITDYKNYVVASTDVDNRKVYDMYDNSKVLSLDEAEKEYVSLQGTNGVEVTFDTIVKWDVISAAESADGEMVSAVVSNKRVEGVISEVSVMDGGAYAEITIEDTVYRTVRNQTLVDSLEPEINGVFYLDVNDQVVAVQAGDQSLKYGYLIAASRTSGLETSVDFKILTESEGVEIFPTAENLRVDDVKIERGTMPPQLTDDGVLEQQLIRYRLNEDDELIEIETANQDVRYDENGLRALTARGSMRYYGQTTTLGGRFMLSTNTLVFVVPDTADGARDEDYAVRSSGYFKTQTNYNVQPFVSVANAAIAEAVVVQEAVSPVIANNSPIICISDTSTVLNGDGDVCGKLYGYNQLGESVNYTTAGVEVMNSANLKVGDVVKVVQNLQGEVTGIAKIYDTTTQVLDTTYANQGDYGNAMRVIKGRAISKNDFLVGASTTSDPITDSTAIDEYVQMEDAMILVCETVNGEKQLRTGAIGDVYDYRSYGEEYSTFVSCLATTVPRLVVVYR